MFSIKFLWKTTLSHSKLIKEIRRFFSTHLKLLSNIGKRDSFIENISWKMTHFLENIIVETNRALVPRQNGGFYEGYTPNNSVIWTCKKVLK